MGQTQRWPPLQEAATTSGWRRGLAGAGISEGEPEWETWKLNLWASGINSGTQGSLQWLMTIRGRTSSAFPRCGPPVTLSRPLLAEPARIHQAKQKPSCGDPASKEPSGGETEMSDRVITSRIYLWYMRGGLEPGLLCVWQGLGEEIGGSCCSQQSHMHIHTQKAAFTLRVSAAPWRCWGRVGGGGVRSRKVLYICRRRECPKHSCWWCDLALPASVNLKTRRNSTVGDFHPSHFSEGTLIMLRLQEN